MESTSSQSTSTSSGQPTETTSNQVSPTTSRPAVEITYEASQSGSFDDPTIWIGGVVPFGDCSIIIPVGIVITFSSEVLNINVRTLTIRGTFTITTSSQIGFAFAYAINIIIFRGGSIIDQTNTNKIYCHADTIFTFLAGASFTGVNTQVIVYIGSTVGQGVGESYILGSSITTVFTLAILVDGTIKPFRSVMCLARQSGSFTIGSTWLGGIAPTADFCASAGGCDLYIPSGFTLSTASLNGQLTIRFNILIIISGGTLQLGTVGSTTGFRFSFSFILNIYGVLEDVTGGTGGIFVPAGSNFNFFEGSTFVSVVATFLIVFDPATGLPIGQPFSLSVSFSGPLFIIISITGEITESRTSKKNMMSVKYHHCHSL